MQPLRRRPKQLDAPPDLFEPTGSGAEAAFRASRGRGAGPAAGGPPGAPTAWTDERGELLDTVPSSHRDLEAVRRARQIAARLALRPPRTDPVLRRGPGRFESVRDAGRGGEIDIDATVENLLGRSAPEPDDVVVVEQRRTRRPVVLVVDVSGSMRGERVRTAAATVGALAASVWADDLACIAFWSDAALLAELGRPSAPEQLLDTLLRLPARGLTNVAFPLEVARRQLRRAPAHDARVLLLSDCVHNAGPDPRVAAAGLPRLDVLLDTSGEHDLDLGRDLATRGRGGFAAVRTHRDVAPALIRMLG